MLLARGRIGGGINHTDDLVILPINRGGKARQIAQFSKKMIMASHNLRRAAVKRQTKRIGSPIVFCPNRPRNDGFSGITFLELIVEQRIENDAARIGIGHHKVCAGDLII